MTAHDLARRADAHVAQAAALLGRPAPRRSIPALEDLEAATRDHAHARAEWRAAEALWWAMVQAPIVLRAVERIARRYAGHMSPEDFVQEGLLGAFRGAKTFDPERGVAFSTHAKWWIRAQVHRSNDQTGHTIALGSQIAETVRQALLVEAELDRHGLKPCTDRVAAELEGLPGLSPRQLPAALAARRGVRSMEFRLPGHYTTGGEEMRLGDTLASELPSPEDEAAERLLGWHIRRLIERAPLTERERSVFLGALDGESYAEATARVGVSLETVRTYRLRGWAALRRAAEAA
jgi:RNA polymerase sigma factor (sigma-70 family)